jgi:asparaginyl-tRNA synthetase
MKRTRIADALRMEEIDRELTLMGWVRNIRPQKKLTFIQVNDGSTAVNAQVVAEPGLPNYDEVFRLGVGSAVSVRGKWVESAGKGQKFELKADEIRVFGTADPTSYPLQPKKHSYEFLREIAHLRSRTATFGAVFRVRNALAYGTHKFFQERGFVYAHTPIISGSDCEGAGEMFKVTAFDLDKVPMTPEGQVDFEKDFFGRSTGLTVSGQLEGELLALGLGDIYTFGPTFRAENSNTARHLSEFWMIEPEMAFYDLADNMDLAEEYLKALFAYVLKQCPEDMAFFQKLSETDPVGTLEHIIESPFVRVTYSEAVDILAGSGQTFEYPVHWGVDLQTEHERYLTEQHFKKPVMVFNYPKDIKAFYMRLNDDGKTVAAVDVLVPRIGEIIGGSQREERLEVLKQRIRDSGLDEKDYWWYLDTRKFGTVPHAGFGLGFGRTVQFVTGMANIRDAIPFPRTPRSAEF